MTPAPWIATMLLSAIIAVMTVCVSSAQTVGRLLLYT
jgi:hypothetical protein